MAAWSPTLNTRCNFMATLKWLVKGLTDSFRLISAGGRSHIPDQRNASLIIETSKAANPIEMMST
eukprot:3601178-Pyramimonas_sp.AAC.2